MDITKETGQLGKETLRKINFRLTEDKQLI